MTPQYRIFYSWQSDDPTSRELIKKALDEVVKKLEKKKTHVIIEQGGGGCGFISIEESIRIKIHRSDIFVGDVTPVGLVNEKSKLLPNANVMFEMGLATECMSPDRILAVAMNGDWKIEDMPFDFNHNTMLVFNKKNGPQKLYSAIVEKINKTNEISINDNKRFFSKRLIDKNIKSKKFLPDTFLENSEKKDLARCFVFPYNMYPFIYEKLKKLNYDHYNKYLLQHGKSRVFKLNLDNCQVDNKIVDIEQLQSITRNVQNYVEKTVRELQKDGNEGYIASIKLDRLRLMLDSINKKVMVITSDAGQGKTNFICDIANTVLKKNNIPFIFINAYELSAESLASSIAAEYNFISNNSLEDVILKASRFCNQQRQYLIIIIDGLNEHPKQGPFKINLTKVLSEVCKYTYVKVLMTCRREYYENNYQSLQNELGENLLQINYYPYTPHTQYEITNNEKCLLDRYGKFFGTGSPSSTKVREKLLSNMLLLRIFFEAYQGQNVEDIPQIDYIDLYQRFFDQQCEKIQQIIEQDSHVDNEKGMAKKLFSHIINWMINKNIFVNLPLEDVQQKMSIDERHCFPTFMSANFILQQDSPEKDFGASEVLNFTFEEIRDYLIVRQLINEEFEKGQNHFLDLINRYTDDDNDQAEGTKRFLFLYAKTHSKKDVIDLLTNQNWYNETLINYVWELPEEKITNDDINKVKKHLLFNPSKTAKTLTYQHWNPKTHPKLNLNLLLDILKKKNLFERKLYLEKIWPSTTKHQSTIGLPFPTERGTILSELRTLKKFFASRKDKQVYNVIEKFEQYLSEGMDSLHVPVQTNVKKNIYDQFFFKYDYDSYLLRVHKGTKDDFLSRAGVKNGFAREMFETIYDSIFAEADDVNSLYENFYSNEYQNLQHFLEMRYSLPQNIAPKYADVCKSSDYRLIDFDAHSYGGNGVREFLMDNDFKERIYKWLNWEDYEN